MSRYAVATSCVLLLLVALASCASTKLTGSWKDPQFSAPDYGKVLVIGMAQRPEVRQKFERVFAAAFVERGLKAVPSFEFLPKDAEMTRATVEKALEGSDIDAVLVTRLAGVETSTEYRSAPSYMIAEPYYHEFSDYYQHVYEAIYEPGYLVTQDTVLLETNLYDVGSGQLACTTRSKSFDPESADDVIGPLSKLVMSRLSRDGMI
ncbi:MAG: hypothetical protein JSV80_00505 [Acidobacteriota bacterium]|nr:MAG: hypothetical protein JSV80_00505 [Acidobacteriota bacterium]